jgi:(S)-ureidoglycine aminohydrolase
MNLFGLGSTRSVVRSNYALLTPDTYVRAPLPGMVKAIAIVHTAPAMGAAFTQYTAEFESSGRLGCTSHQRFVYVLEGELSVKGKDVDEPLVKDGFAFIPARMTHTVEARTAARAVVIEKEYRPLDGVASPGFVAGVERTIEPQPLMGDADLQVRAMIPADPSYDLAVNTMTYAPGAALSMVEAHAMEHGLLMLEGQGIYRLCDEWLPTSAGDFIWMGPYCPQWFGALGKTPARYLIYKDWNRHPLS